jgi:hypothetical protein
MMNNTETEITFTDETMFTVMNAIIKAGITMGTAITIITEMHNAGIVFRERVK